MPVQKLQTTDGFIVRDFADTPSSGVVRRGRKILQRSATDLARSATYGFAFYGVERGGASAGLNAEGDAEGPALVALISEVREQLDDGRLELAPAKGIGPGELAAALSGDSPEAPTGTDAGGLDDGAEDIVARGVLAEGVLGATSWALGGSIDGRRLFIEGDASDPTRRHLVAAATAAGAEIVEPDPADAKPWTVWATEADAVLVGSRPGVMNHQGAELLNTSVVIPWAQIPVTTKALAIMIARNITYVPDFVAASGPLVGRHLGGTDAPTHRPFGERLVAELDGLRTGDDPLFIAACHRAETFLASWQEKLPFGRPLAG